MWVGWASRTLTAGSRYRGWTGRRCCFTPAAGRSVGLKLVIQDHVLATGGFMATPAVEATSICSPTTMAWPAQRQKGWPQPVDLDGLFVQPAPTGDDVRVCPFSL